MTKIRYRDHRFGDDALRIITRAEAICQEYAARGFTLTLRQVYYQFVARGYLGNNDKNYKMLGGTLERARMAGLIDWNHMEDRTRHSAVVNMWDDPAQVLRATARQYRLDPWKDQDYHVEVWVEKEALAGVIAVPADRNRLTHFCCRGYVSASASWQAAQRLVGWAKEGKRNLIIHLGDHDPSGVDMTRDITERVTEMLVHHGADEPEIRRIALNMDQITLYNPPPNPAKVTDSRFAKYAEQYGEESWELDALDPDVIDRLIQDVVDEVLDEEAWEASLEQEKGERSTLVTMSRQWSRVVEFVTGSASAPADDDEEDD